MNTRPHLQPYLNNSLAIRQEIQRFESVHPSIYAIYDLIELVPDALVAQQIRDHVVCIEDSFVNSQEWTLSRSVPDLRLGIVGSLASGKSALVHRYLTGSYMQEESPEGGRFKKEILVEGQSYLLLIRDEGGPPELQFTSWVDAVIFVFSVENESSFNAIYNYYTKMAHFRNSAEIPLILVGTQDAISENNPRVIDDSRARKLATDLKRCSYYETCATYGLNVERVFQDACQKIVQQRLSTTTTCITPTNSRPSTPNTHFAVTQTSASVNTMRHHPLTTAAVVVAPSPTNNGFCSPPVAASIIASPSHTQILNLKDGVGVNASRQNHTLSSTNHIMRHLDSNKLEHATLRGTTDLPEKWSNTTDNNNITKFPPVSSFDNLPPPQAVKDKDLPTPSSTPTTSRKSRRRSNLFTPSKRNDDKLKNGGEVGSGRAIPVKQGYLYKRSSKPLNKDWKKKYVTLCDDGKLTYHPSLHDYMDDVHGKDISLQYVTVKVPGQKPRGSKTIQSHGTGVLTSLNQASTSANDQPSTSKCNDVTEGVGCLTITNLPNKDKRQIDKVTLTGFEQLRESATNRLTGQSTDDTTYHQNHINGTESKLDTPNVKKRHRRMKSSGLKNSEVDDSDGYEFLIVSLDNKQWHFEATNSEERDQWVMCIEQQILNSLQHIESCTLNPRVKNSAEAGSMLLIRTQVPGNGNCADCNSQNPDWASLNLGVVICIECSGIHRNLGSHISKVRSLDLDDWPLSHVSVMLLIGNLLANEVWESSTRGRAKPTPNSSREEKERWIRAKYEAKEFLTPITAVPQVPQPLIEGVIRADMKAIVHALACASPEQVNSTISPRDLRTSLHLACAMTNLGVAQLLIFHNANVMALDHENRSCLEYARTAANRGQGKENVLTTTELALIELLLANGCPDVPSGTLLRRRGDATIPLFDLLPSSVI